MDTAKTVRLIEHHPKAPDASPERLRQVLGSIPLQGPAPSTKFMDDPDDEQSAERERD